MTKIAHKIFLQLHETARDGLKKSGMHPARDGYAALWIWINCGQSVERIATEDVAPIPSSLRLDTAPLAKQAVGYTLPDSADWLVLARIGAGDPIYVDQAAFAYPEPMLVWAGWRAERRGILSGCINLGHHPTVEGLRLAPGKNYGELGAADLVQADADDDLMAVGQCIGRFYR